MFTFVTAEPNLPFSIALALMLAIAALEGVGSVMGLGISAVLDQLTPEFDVDADAPDIGEHGAFAQLLGWLHWGRLPVLILLLVFLTAFGLIGLGLQWLVRVLSGDFLPAALAGLFALPPALVAVRWGGASIGRLLPGDETEAVSTASFVGRVATVSLGTARYDAPTQARLRDRFGQTHYLMVTPDRPDDCFDTGTEVLVVKQQGGLFRVIRNTRSALID